MKNILLKKISSIQSTLANLYIIHQFKFLICNLNQYNRIFITQSVILLFNVFLRKKEFQIFKHELFII